MWLTAVGALARRDGIRTIPDGMTAANQFRLTSAAPAKASYLTDGATRDIRIRNRTIRLKHAAPAVMAWAGRPARPVVQELRWLGPMAALDAHVVSTLRRTLPDDVENDIARNKLGLPGWAAQLVHSLTELSFGRQALHLSEAKSGAQERGSVQSGPRMNRHCGRCRSKFLCQDVG